MNFSSFLSSNFESSSSFSGNFSGAFVVVDDDDNDVDVDDAVKLITDFSPSESKQSRAEEDDVDDENIPKSRAGGFAGGWWTWGLFCLLLLGVSELDTDVKDGNDASGKLHEFVAEYPVLLGAGHGSVTVIPVLCGRAEHVLLGENLSKGCVLGTVLSHEVHHDGGLGLVHCVEVVGMRGGCIPLGGGIAKAVGIPLPPGLAHAGVRDLAGDDDG